MLMARIATALILSLAVATAADAQGGLIKRKVGDALKKQADPKPAEAESNQDGAPYELNAAAMTAFKSALELEIRLRDDYRARVAKLKTPEQYKECETEFAMSPDAQKILEEYTKRSENVKTSEDMEKVTEWFGTTMTQGMTKKCGLDPSSLRNAQRDEFGKAELAAALEFKKGWTLKRPKGGEPEFGDPEPNEFNDDAVPLGTGPFAGWPAFTTSSSHTAGRVQPDDEAKTELRVLKERVKRYCQLSANEQAAARQNGIRVPGQGSNIFWIFSPSFANWVGDDCAVLMKLMSKLDA